MMLAVDIRPIPVLPTESTSSAHAGPSRVAAAPGPRKSAQRARQNLENLSQSSDRDDGDRAYEAEDDGADDELDRISIKEVSSPIKRPPSRTQRRFVCSFEGCDKAYFKPSRLAEHELTHTGVRPHQCAECPQSYLRASHLKAHLRTHLSNEERPFACTRDGCDKRFWTATHLKRHEKLHDETPSFECGTCGEKFHKARHLRDHNVLEHMPPGTKPYPCTHEGCTWSFALHHQLKAHLKTHDTTRYTCSHPDHGDDSPCFSTWSSLQTHLHEAHPPTCPFAECNGRVFKSHQRLKDHLKVHTERMEDLSRGVNLEVITTTDDEAVLSDAVGQIKESRRAKKRRMSGIDGDRPVKMPRLKDGEAGKDFKCDHPDCNKAFKTKFALGTHAQAKHSVERPHKCPHSDCHQAYAYKSNLQRHLATHDKTGSGDRLSESEGENGAAAFTGETFGKLAYACPAHLARSRLPKDASQEDGASSEEVLCTEKFGRMYDLRRHLAAVHDLQLDAKEIEQLIQPL